MITELLNGVGGATSAMIMSLIEQMSPEERSKLIRYAPSPTRTHSHRASSQPSRLVNVRVVWVRLLMGLKPTDDEPNLHELRAAVPEDGYAALPPHALRVC